MENPIFDTSDVSMKSTASDEDMFAVSQDMFASSPVESKVSESFKEDSNNVETPPPNTIDEEKKWRGTPLDKLPRYTGKGQYPPVAVGSHHSVFFKLPVKQGEVPSPWPEKPLDVWDQTHVRMPHSVSSLYPVNETELRKRWELVRQSLTSQISTSQQLEAAIFHYNSKYCERWSFVVLHTFFSETLEEIESEYFFAKVLPKVVDIALNLPSLVTNGVPLLRQHSTHSISLTQQQISSLLANAFLCTYPRRNTTKKGSEYCTYPYINFNRLFNGDFIKPSRSNCVQEKLKCIINYFRRVTTKVPEGVVTFSRHYVPPDKLPVWADERCLLQHFHVSSEGTIEDEGEGMIQMDFANKNVGGGVLGSGCVQEEIRFVICPELIVARLFTEALDETEALIVNGVERYSTYSGYSENFEWAGDFQDSTPRDSYGRRYCTVVAIDALHFASAKTQYTAANINRELNKAYAGFSWGSDCKDRSTVATGNWGCGAFKGDACLKALLQLMVAAKTGRALVYFTFGDEDLRDTLAKMHSFLVDRQVTVGRLWKIITSYRPLEHHHSLYDHIYQSVDSGSIPVPMKSMTPPKPKKPRIQQTDDTGSASKSIDIQSHKKTGNRLSVDDIEKELELTDSMEEEDGVRPVEGKTINLNSDKELCLKKLSSSWTNLNDSKKDFKPKNTLPAETSNEKAVSNDDCSSSHTSSTNISTNRKKKISDYFQPAAKHKS